MPGAGLDVVSLFSGVGGIDLAFERAGCVTRLLCEKDRYAADVLARHWPDVPVHRDVHDVTVADLHAVAADPDRTVLVGGFPCQPFSVAGRRGGERDPRGTLFFEVYRLVTGYRPAWVVLENVPGLLSIDSGQQITKILDLLTGAGYLVDMDVLDAQNFGVPQRRRRVVLLCHRGDLALHAATVPSALTVTRMLVECLTDHDPGGLAQRLNLLSPDLGSLLVTAAATLGGSVGAGAVRAVRALATPGSRVDDLARAQAVTSIAGLAAGATDLTPSAWLNTSVMLAALKGCIDHAGQASGADPGTLGRSEQWAAVVGQAERLIESLRRRGSTGTAPGQVLPDTEGGGRDLAPGCDASPQPATEAARGARRPRSTRRGRGVGDRTVVSALTASRGGPDDNEAQAGHLVTGSFAPTAVHDQDVVTVLGSRTHTLTAEGADASDDGTGRGTPIVAATLTAGSSAPNVSPPGRRQEDDENLVAFHLTQDPVSSDTVVPAAGVQVRRLTPLECERLQGHPDGWTRCGASGPQSNAQRYKQMGNGVAVPVFEWVAHRLVEVDAASRAPSP